MATIAPLTSEQFATLPSSHGRRELISGEVRMMSPSGWRHGEIVSRLHFALSRHVYTRQLGRLFGAETGFVLERNPDTVRAPDIAFIATQNLPAQDPKGAFWPAPPDLAVEVLSPSDRTGEVDEKIRAWLGGKAEVWAVDPELETVTVYRSRTEIKAFGKDSVLDGGPLLPEFRLPIAEIFSR